VVHHSWVIAASLILVSANKETARYQHVPSFAAVDSALDLVTTQCVAICPSKWLLEMGVVVRHGQRRTMRQNNGLRYSQL